MHRDHGPLRGLSLTLALTTSRPTNHACLHRGDQLIWVLLFVELFDLCRLDESHGTATAALLALAAPPPMLADAAAAALLALGAPPSVLADATAATVFAPAALPPVLALLSHFRGTFRSDSAARKVNLLDRRTDRQAGRHTIGRPDQGNARPEPPTSSLGSVTIERVI